MSQWVYGAYNATLNIQPCEGDMVEYSAEVEEALKKYGLREFEGFPLSTFFWALSGSPLTAILTSGVGQNLIKSASSVSANGGVIHLEFEDKPFEVDLEPFRDLFGHRYAHSRPLREVKGESRRALVSSGFKGLTWAEYVMGWRR